MSRGDEYIFGIKVRRQVPYQHAKSLRALLCFLHHRHPVADDGVHSHIEEHGGQGISLGNSAVPLEGDAIVPAGPVHNGKLAPVRPENPERPGA